MKTISIAFFLFLAACIAAGHATYRQIKPRWAVQASGVTARLRGVSAVDQQVAWASGSASTVLRTTNGGANWQKLTVTDEQLDFRDIDAFDSSTAYILSVGNGPQSRIYKTIDGGKTWSLQFKNEDPKGFLDAMSFWNAKAGIVYGDSIDGRLFIMTTENGGRTWDRVPHEALPPALENEGAFAASGTNIAVFGKDHAWIGTGGASKSRVLRTDDRGHTWKVSETPLIAGSSAGIFSIAFRDEKHGVIVGGDYKKEVEATDNLAVTSDGGITWKLVKGLSGFRSAVAFVPAKRTVLIAVGPSGADYSIDDGASWTTFESQSFDTLSFARGKPVGWAAGIRGNVGMLRIE
jgi:photosystem II stability/assembly factor-like uncharacterized protein